LQDQDRLLLELVELLVTTLEGRRL